MTFQVCWRCAATRGNSNIECVYTDISETAAWRSMPVQEPWEQEPVATSIWGWDLSLVGIDLLHVLHLGILRDLCGSAIKVLVSKRGFFRGATIPKRLQEFTRQLKLYAKVEKLQLYLRNVKKTTVDWRSDKCPELRCKAADCATILKFLAWKTQQEEPPAYKGMVACIWAADRFVRILFSAGMYLTPAERESAYACGDLYLNLYLSLACEAVESGTLLWKVRPKYHYCWHAVNDLLSKGRNPSKDATWMDEDVMRHTFHMRRKMCARKSPLNMLKRYLVVAKTAMDKHLGLS
eukprot:s3615_g9.t1